ncbi:hypothetical protein [Marinicella sp. W31]|uniref:hypothetical protein n=1 Tax=Marinicella sp. W31 TaxID=3023713 RepID=UPI0037578876
MYQLIFFIVFISFSVVVRAAVFCVSNGTELLSVIQTASSNGQDDEIRLKNGDYSHPSQLPFYIDLRDQLEISGGWRDIGQLKCGGTTLGSNPMDTTIDGNDQSPVLFFTYNNSFPEVSVKIRNLTIANGYSSVNGIASGLQMNMPLNHVGEVVVERVYFIGNHSVHRSAASISRAANTTIQNSVFQFNNSDNGNGAVYVAPFVSTTSDANNFYFINNTLVFNRHKAPSIVNTNSSGLKVLVGGTGNGGAAPNVFIANNLFWDNDFYDLYISPNSFAYSYNNNFESFSGATNFGANSMSEPPMLAPQLLDFTPQPGSPLINRGLAAPNSTLNPPPFAENWDYGTVDFDSGLRVVDGRVDIGAVEALPEVPIFKDGFE